MPDLRWDLRFRARLCHYQDLADLGLELGGFAVGFLAGRGVHNPLDDLRPVRNATGAQVSHSMSG